MPTSCQCATIRCHMWWQLRSTFISWVQATIHDRMPLDWAAWAAHGAQYVATASALIALSRAGSTGL